MSRSFVIGTCSRKSLSGACSCRRTGCPCRKLILGYIGGVVRPSRSCVLVLCLDPRSNGGRHGGDSNFRPASNEVPAVVVPVTCGWTRRRQVIREFGLQIRGRRSEGLRVRGCN